MTRSLEKRYRSKPHAIRKRRERDNWHWLSSGLIGRQSLLLDIDAPLYAIDAHLSRLVASCAHTYDGNEERPFALFMPPVDQLGWQIDYLSKEYNVYLWSDPSVDQLDGAQLVSGDIEPQIDRWIDLFLTTEYRWLNEDEYTGYLREVLPMLSPEGSAACVLTAIGYEDSLELVWGDGSMTSLTEFVERPPFAIPAPTVSGKWCLSAIDPKEPDRMNAFLKRNRRFFGRDVRELLLDRLCDPEVASYFRADRDPALWVVVLKWSSRASY